MMSPLNILNPPNSAVDSTTPASSHSPDLSKSPSSMLLNNAAAAAAAAAGGLSLPVGPLPGAAAASLLHAFGNNSANALAQMFPGFPLHMAAAAAAAFYGQPHPHQPPTSQGATPFTHVAPPAPGQFSPQQQQQVNTILAAARENQILAQMNQKKIHEDSHIKQTSSPQSMPPPPPTSTMISPSAFQNRSNQQPNGALGPLAMMARGQQNSPQNHQLSPSLYNQSFRRKLPAESADVPTSCPSSTSDTSKFSTKNILFF